MLAEGHYAWRWDKTGFCFCFAGFDVFQKLETAKRGVYNVNFEPVMTLKVW